MLHLILGGARSGKSRWAEQRAQALMAKASNKQGQLIYIATATASDAEMQSRIAHHRRQREHADFAWHTIEAPLDWSEVLAAYNRQGNVIVVDCLSLWLNNGLHHQCWDAQRDTLLNYLDTHSPLMAEVLLVSNEVGSGIVPMGELSRRFVDESGWLHQALAQRCETVSLIVAGLPMMLKGTL